MKAYKEYMNGLTVSDALHRKLVSLPINIKNKPEDRRFISRRFMPAFACLALIILGFLTVPLLQSTILPQDSSAARPDAIHSTLTGKSYSLYFNKVKTQTSANIYIPGHFWQDLSPAEIGSVFPLLSQTHTISATANFSGDGKLFNIEAHATSSSGLVTYIQLAKGSVALDCSFESKTKASDIMGTTVTAGYFEGSISTLYFASFMLGETDYYVQIQGGETEKKELGAVVGQLIEGNITDLNALVPVRIPRS